MRNCWLGGGGARGLTKHKVHLHFKETCDKNNPVYETFYLDGNQENSKLEIFQLFKEKRREILKRVIPKINIIRDATSP